MPERGPRPLWVKSGHMQCSSRCPLRANSGHCERHPPQTKNGRAISPERFPGHKATLDAFFWTTRNASSLICFVPTLAFKFLVFPECWIVGRPLTKWRRY